MRQEGVSVVLLAASIHQKEELVQKGVGACGVHVVWGQGDVRMDNLHERQNVGKNSGETVTGNGEEEKGIGCIVKEINEGYHDTNCGVSTTISWWERSGKEMEMGREVGNCLMVMYVWMG